MSNCKDQKAARAVRNQTSWFQLNLTHRIYKTYKTVKYWCCHLRMHKLAEKQITIRTLLTVALLKIWDSTTISCPIPLAKLTLNTTKWLLLMSIQPTFPSSAIATRKSLSRSSIIVRIGIKSALKGHQVKSKITPSKFNLYNHMAIKIKHNTLKATVQAS